MAKHALLSASGAHRWLLCTPSAQLEQKFPASTSAYAEEGTVAHALAELTTRYFLGELDKVSYRVKWYNETEEVAKSMCPAESAADPFNLG